MLNKIFLETDGLVVGGTQLTTSGGSVGVANNIYVGGNTITGNLTVTGTFTYAKANVAIPAFSVFTNSPVVAPDRTYTQIQYNTIEFDTNNCFNSQAQWAYVNGIYAPPWSFAPNVPGYYMINATLNGAANGTAGAFVQIALYKQSSIYRLVNVPYGGGAQPTATLSTVVYMNGVSDYLSIYGWQNTGGSVQIGLAGSTYSFNGCLIRPA